MKNYPRLRDLLNQLDEISTFQVYYKEKWVNYQSNSLAYNSISFLCYTNGDHPKHILMSIQDVEGFRTTDGMKPKLIPILNELKSLIIGEVIN